MYMGEAIKRTDGAAWSLGAPPTTVEKTRAETAPAMAIKAMMFILLIMLIMFVMLIMIILFIMFIMGAFWSILEHLGAF